RHTRCRSPCASSAFPLRGFVGKTLANELEVDILQRGPGDGVFGEAPSCDLCLQLTKCRVALDAQVRRRIGRIVKRQSITTIQTGSELRQRAECDQPPCADDADSVAEALSLLHVMRRQDNAC